MAKIDRMKIKTGWYNVDLVEVHRAGVDGLIVVSLDPESLIVNRRHPAYWWHMAKTAVKMGKEALVRRITRTN